MLTAAQGCGAWCGLDFTLGHASDQPEGSAGITIDPRPAREMLLPVVRRRRCSQRAERCRLGSNRCTNADAPKSARLAVPARGGSPRNTAPGGTTKAEQTKALRRCSMHRPSGAKRQGDVRSVGAQGEPAAQTGLGRTAVPASRHQCSAARTQGPKRSAWPGSTWCARRPALHARVRGAFTRPTQ